METLKLEHGNIVTLNNGFKLCCHYSDSDGSGEPVCDDGQHSCYFIRTDQEFCRNGYCKGPVLSPAIVFVPLDENQRVKYTDKPDRNPDNNFETSSLVIKHVLPIDDSYLIRKGFVRKRYLSTNKELYFEYTLKKGDSWIEYTIYRCETNQPLYKIIVNGEKFYFSETFKEPITNEHMDAFAVLADIK